MVSYGFFLALEAFLLFEEVERETLQVESSRSKKKSWKKGEKKKEGGKGTEEGGKKRVEKRDCVASGMTSSYYQLLVYLLSVHL